MTGELFNDFPPTGDFLTDEHRRVLGNLSQPRSLEDLVAFLARHDEPHTSIARTLKGAESILTDLEAHGLVTSLGAFTADTDHKLPKHRAGAAATAAVTATADRDDVPTLPADKADNYIERAQRSGIHPFPDRAGTEELWYWTEIGRAKLMAPIPNQPPPMQGTRLDAALEHDARLAERDAEITAQARALQIKQLRDRADQLEADDDEETDG
jgi:hypothetical protein